MRTTVSSFIPLEYTRYFLIAIDTSLQILLHHGGSFIFIKKKSVRKNFYSEKAFGFKR